MEDRLEAVHRALIPAGRMCTVEEVARFVGVLSGDDVDWFNGATIDFTGGLNLGLFERVLNGYNEKRPRQAQAGAKKARQ